MDNPQAADQLNALIHQQVHHELEHFGRSPELVNRMVGESMRHIGSFLELSSASYLPVRPEEILAPPERIAPGSRDAVLLITRTVSTENSFLVLANNKINGAERKFDLYAFKLDNFALNKSKFLKLPEAIGNEILRQLNLIMKTEGSAIVQVVVVKNYFSEEEPQGDLFNSNPAEEAPAPAPAAAAAPAPGPAAEPTAGGLPAVVHDHALL